LADFWYNGFGATLDEAMDLYQRIKELHPSAPLEVWEIEPNKYGNRYVVITRQKQRGPNPKLRFVRKIKP